MIKFILLPDDISKRCLMSGIVDPRDARFCNVCMYYTLQSYNTLSLTQNNSSTEQKHMEKQDAEIFVKQCKIPTSLLPKIISLPLKNDACVMRLALVNAGYRFCLQNYKQRDGSG